MFWDDEVADFGEQLVLADEAGVIGSVDIDELLAGIAQAAVSRPRKLRLASEDEADRAVFGQRLDRLRRSPRLRRDYVQLLGELWAEVDVAWRANGLPARARSRPSVAGAGSKGVPSGSTSS